MTMNAEEARRITDPNGTFSNDDPTRLRAEAYLSGYADGKKESDEEVGKLVEALEKIRHASWSGNPMDDLDMRQVALEALSAHREATKEKG